MGPPPPTLECGVMVPEKFNAKVHMVDTSTTEVISHRNAKDGDHVKVKRKAKEHEHGVAAIDQFAKQFTKFLNKKKHHHKRH